MKRIIVAILGFAALAMAAVGAQAEPFKVGFVYVGPVGDHGWTYRHNEGRKAVEAAFGDKVKTTYVESVKEGGDAERVIRQLAASGHGIIFTTSFGYMNPTVKVAKQFPKVKFEHATGYKRAANVSTYSGRFYEGRTVAGIIAGRMTKSNVIGYIGSFPIPEVVRGINAFTIALRRVNPEATVKVVWVSTWYDPGKEAEAAKVLMDQGADVILQHTDSTAPIQAAQDAGKWAVGQASDMTQFAPKAHLTAIVDNWDKYYVSRVKAAMDGTWTSEDTWTGLKEGMVEMTAFNDAIPDEVKTEAQAAHDAIIAGTLHPFQGPFNKQDGSVGAKEGETLDDKTLLGMNWYVEGVEGQLPK
ncbi:MAG: BMP family ABC transporter substrate-binding protein [Pseudomonadota bacterium]